MRLLNAARNWKVRTKGLGMKAWNWSVATENFQILRVGADWLPAKGGNRRIVTEVMQRKTWDWRLGTEVLHLKVSNWMFVTDGTGKWQLKFCNWRGLGLKVWDWRLGLNGCDKGLHKEIIYTLSNTFINRSQTFFMLFFQNEGIN